MNKLINLFKLHKQTIFRFLVFTAPAWYVFILTYLAVTIATTVQDNEFRGLFIKIIAYFLLPFGMLIFLAIGVKKIFAYYPKITLQTFCHLILYCAIAILFSIIATYFGYLIGGIQP